MMRKKVKKNDSFVLMFFLLMVICSLCGCGSDKGEKEKEMGRYVEMETAVPDMLTDLSSVKSVKVLQDHSLACMVQSFLYISHDNGETWEMDSCLDLSGEKEGETAAVSAASLDSEGNILCVYNSCEEGEEEKKGVPYKAVSELWICNREDGTYHQIPNVEPELTVTGIRKSYGEDEKWQQAYDYLTLSGGINSDKTLEEFIKEYQGYGIEDPQILVDSFKSMVSDGLDIRETILTGKSVFLLIGEDYVLQLNRETGEKENSYSFSYLEKGLWNVADGKLFASDQGEIRIFDTKSGEEISDKETTALSSLELYPRCIGISGDEKTLYIGSSKGLYAHEIGTDSVELLLEGTMSSFCATGKNWYGILECEDKGLFLFSSEDGTVSGARFVYDAETARYPDRELEIYSLNEILGMDAMIARFQTVYPDVHVTYTYGKSGNSDGVTTSDALKVLNTKILAGTGPDLIFLDRMPIETYMKNGMLEKLDDLIDEAGDTIFTKIAGGLSLDDHTYAVPLCFQMPVMIGYRQEIENINTLDELLELVNKIASDEEDTAMVTDQTIPKGTLATMYISNSSLIFRDDGSLNSQELTKYLEACKDIYDLSIQRKAYAIRKQEDMLNNLFEDDETNWMDEYIEQEDATSFVTNVSSFLSSVFYKKIHFTMGTLGKGNLIDLFLSMDADPDFIMKGLPGDIKNCYVGKNYVGVNSLGKNKDTAKEFVKFLLTEKGQQMYQDVTYSQDFPVNRNTFRNQLQKAVEEEAEFRSGREDGGTMVCENEDGTKDTLPYKEPDEEFYDTLAAYADSLETPMYNNLDVFNTIAQMGASYLKGEETVDVVAETIVDKMDLYLSE